MPNETTEFTKITINFVYALGGGITLITILWGVVARYGAFVIKTLNEKIVNLKEEIINLKKDIVSLKKEKDRNLLSIEKTLELNRKQHEEHFNEAKETNVELVKTSTKIENLKEIHDHIHRKD